jgi:hypothetical protein
MTYTLKRLYRTLLFVRTFTGKAQQYTSKRILMNEQMDLTKVAFTKK